VSKIATTESDLLEFVNDETNHCIVQGDLLAVRDHCLETCFALGASNRPASDEFDVEVALNTAL
jgi:hypothetical protein